MRMKCMLDFKMITRRIFVAAVSLLILLQIFVIGVSAEKVEYEGKGTAKNPYLVKTVEQLDGMRNKLSATYKLSANIDLSGVQNFKPIGNLAKPFTGTFLCDTDENGAAKYIIKNLTVSVEPAGATLAEKYSGYKKDGTSGWEAGLFGATDSATLKNIVILDAKISNTVEGNYAMNSDYSTNPGMDEMATGILVAIGDNTKIIGCGCSGTVTSATNHVGGLIGVLNGGSIKQSYSYATVTSTGKWGTGGLIGSASDKVTIKESFYNGTFSGGVTHAGAFGGSVLGDEITIEDCYSAGIVKTASSGCFVGTKNHADKDKKTPVQICKNCLCLSTIEGRVNAQTNKRVSNGNYITDAPGGLMVGFAAASITEINSAFSALANWSVKDGEYPQLKNVHPITDASLYTVSVEDTVDTSSVLTSSEAVTSSQPDSNNEETENADEGSVEVIVNDSMMKMSKSERILIIAMAVIITIAVILSVVIIIHTFIFTRRVKTSIVDGEGIYSENDDIGDNESYS